MLKRNIPQLMACGIASLLFSGCVSVVKTGTRADEPPPRFAETVQAFCNNDYDAVKPVISPELREQLNEARFQTAVAGLKQFGKISEVTYLASVRQGATFSELWKIALVKTNHCDEPMTTERVLRIVGGMTDGKPQVIGLMLQ